MTTELVATVLGCGSSPGVPRIGNDWGDCDPNEPRNRRTRCSMLVERFGDGDRPTRVLVDTSPELRQQLLDARVDRLDGVLYTHAHADHLHGIDDLRAFRLRTNRLLDVYADAPTEARILEAFAYCVRTPPGGSYPPILKMNRIAAGEPFAIEGPGGPLGVVPYQQAHGDSVSLGFRFGGLAYSCDLSGLSEESASLLAGLDVWIVDALRHAPHPSHLSLSQALEWIERLKPRRAVLTHMDSSLDYVRLTRELPPGVEPAYDGMRIAF